MLTSVRASLATLMTGVARTANVAVVTAGNSNP